MPADLAGLTPLLERTAGSGEVKIGMIDGPVDTSHHDFRGARLTEAPGASAACREQGSPACVHGTFVAGMLAARRGSPAPALCPECPVVVRPIFCEAADLGQCPAVTPGELASALRQAVDSGVRIVNLSIGLANTAVESHPALHESFDYAFRKGVLIVAAAGNHGRISHIPLFDHPWVIPVAACDEKGNILAGSNFGPSLGKRGLLAPGSGIRSLAPGGGYTTMSGTSVAAPFVTGTIALLWSLYPTATAEQMRSAILLPGARRRTIIPPLLNGDASSRALQARR